MIKVLNYGLLYTCNNCKIIGSNADIIITVNKDNTIVLSLYHDCRVEMIKLLAESLKESEEKNNE
jgi:hypothetical protein